MVTSKIFKWLFGRAAAIAVLCGVGVAMAAPPIIPTKERRFDHARHEASAKSASEGKRQVAACADCHRMDAKGATVTAGGEHATRCIKCHDNPKTCPQVQQFAGTPKNPARRCDICHLPTGNCKLPALPDKPSGPNFASRFAHAEHIGFKVSIERDCANCHPQNAPTNAALTGPTGHASCWRCHAGPGGVSTKLQSSNCAGCHQAPKGKTGPSSDPFRLAKFDHRKHHTESKQASCTGCHDAKKMATNDPNAVPRPSMSTCVGACHDGQKAFSGVGTTCTKCHKSAGGLATPFPKEAVFSHAKHANRNVKIDACASCHSVKDDGNVEAPNAGKNHQPCAASGCHQTEFMSKTVKICGVCHDKAAPWEKAVARMHDPPPEQEFFENINHKTHLAKKGTTNASCNDCHGDKLGGGKAPKGHTACIECHGKGPPAHAMTECGKCHSRDAAKRPPVSEWSVKDTFVHARHANDSRSRKTTNCAECHAQIAASTSLAQMAKPKMESCAGCHNGKVSFKTTGFDCSKCHTKGKQPSTPSAGPSFTTPGNQAGLFDQHPSGLLSFVELQDRR